MSPRIRTVLKCLTPSCHMHIKVTERGMELLRETSLQERRDVGLVCPRCVKANLSGESEEYALRIPLGEQVAESLVDKPDWRIGLIPNRATPGPTTVQPVYVVYSPDSWSFGYAGNRGELKDMQDTYGVEVYGVLDPSTWKLYLLDGRLVEYESFDDLHDTLRTGIYHP